jgi:hypothetical protein
MVRLRSGVADSLALLVIRPEIWLKSLLVLLAQVQLSARRSRP